MSRVEASGAGGIAVGHDVKHSILVTGNANQFFFGEYQGLLEAYVDPWSVFDRVNLKRFSGRGWLESRVDDFLNQNDRGLFILEAGAGLGKTAFLAYLARQRNYAHHFVELRPGLEGVAPGLMSLAAQLVRTWELKPYITQAALPASVARPEFFQNLLKAAAGRRDQTEPGEKIVLVVDALDEAGTPPGQNVMGLPRALPAGVYLIVSQRPVEVTLVVEGPRHVEPLKAEDENNLADMQAFLEKALTWPGIQKHLGEGRISDSQFVETLLEKSRGVWIYLHYVVAEIEAPRNSPLKLDDLPRDLWQYYADYWDRWREAHSQTWDSEDLHLLTTLAVAQDSLTLDTLLALAGIDRKPDVSERIGEVLDFKWVPYLAVSTAGSYRFQHASLRDFFNGAIDQRNLSEAQRRRVLRFAKATKAAHTRIADFYIQRWGGWDASLSALQKINPARDDTLDRYGLRHLVAHLKAAGREDEVHRLMRLEWSDQQGEQRSAGFENSWYTVHERVGDASGYLNDMDRAWQLAGQAYDGRQSSSAIGLQCRYALMVASLCSLAGNIPPALLAALVEKGIWPGPQGLAYARQVQDDEQRSQALAAVAPYLDRAELDQALREALAAARAIENKQSRSHAIAALAPHLTEPLLPEAMEVAQAIDEGDRSQVLAALAPRLTEPMLHVALATARATRDVGFWSQALAALAPRLTEPMLREVLEAARSIEHEGARSYALAALALHLTEPMLRVALEAARVIKNEGARSQALAALAPRLAELGQAADALSVTRDIPDDRWRSQSLAELAPRLTEPMLHEALETARAIRDEGFQSGVLAALAPQATWWVIRDVSFRSHALAALAPRLTEPILREALEAARAIENEGARSQALAALAPRLAELGQAAEALSVTRVIQDDWWRAHALAALAPHLNEPMLRQALETARAIKNEGARSERQAVLTPQGRETRIGPGSSARSHALVGLTPRLAELGHPEEALEVTRSIEGELARSWELYGPGNRLVGQGWSNKGELARSWALAALAPHLTEPMIHEALEAAQAIEKWDRSHALAALAWRLADLGHAGGALKATQAMDQPPRSRKLAELVRYMTEPMLHEALKTVPAIGNEEFESQVLAALAPRLTEPMLRQALEAARAMEYEQSRSQALAALAPHLTEPMLRQALEAARAIRDKGDFGPYQSWVLAALAPRLAKLGQPAEALEVAQAIVDKTSQSAALAALAPHLTEPMLRQALKTARAIRDEGARSEALAARAPHLTEPLLCEAVKTAPAIKSESTRWGVLAGLAPHLTDPLLREAVSVARDIEWEGGRSQALAALAPRLAELGDTAEALSVARDIQDKRLRSEALTALAPHLAPEEREHVLHEALSVARDIERQFSGCWPLAELALHLAPAEQDEVLHEALSVARETGFEDYRWQALATLAPRLAPTERDQVLHEALSLARGIKHEASRWQALAGMAPRLAELGDPAEALSVARDIQDNDQRWQALAALIPHLAPAEQDQVLGEALSAARDIQYGESRSLALAALAPRLAPAEQDKVLREALSVARDIKEEYNRRQPLAALAPLLAERGDLAEALSVARDIQDGERPFGADLLGNQKEWRWQALAAVAPHLEPAEQDQVLGEALSAARDIQDEKRRSEAMAALAPRLAKLPRAELYRLWIETILVSATRKRESLLWDLGALLPMIAALGGSEAMADTVRAIQDVGRWWP